MSDVLGSDETTMRVNSNTSYLWAFQNGKATYFTGNQKRNYDVIKNTIGEDFKGYWVSDRFGGQLKVDTKHQLCLSHLIRDCQYTIDVEDSEFGLNLQNILKQSIHLRNMYGDEYNPYKEKLYREIRKLKEDLTTIFKIQPNDKESKRLWKSLVGRQHQILLFLENKIIPATNNASEQALRNRVTKRKVSGCFRSEEGSDCNDILSSIIETAKKLNVNLFDALSLEYSFVF